jgi:Protein of unknown function (DUF3617)
MMRRTVVAATTLAWVMAASVPISAEDSPPIRLEPGLWTFQFKLAQDGPPAPDKTESGWFTAAQVGDPVHTFLRPVDNSCTVRQSVTGRTLTFTATCHQPGGTIAATIEGSFVFEDTRHFTQSVRTVSTTATRKTEVTLAADARLTGPCPN